MAYDLREQQSIIGQKNQMRIAQNQQLAQQLAQQRKQKQQQDIIQQRTNRPQAGGVPQQAQQPSYVPQSSISDPYKQFETAQEKANAANEARYKEGLGKYQQVEGIYDPKGTFGAGQEAAINVQKQRDVAAGMQSLVGAGMGNTTIAASLPQAWESNVGSQARLNLADLRSERQAGAKVGTAGFIERRTDKAPDMGQYANLVQQANTNYNTGQGGQTYQPTPISVPQPVQQPQPGTPTEGQKTPGYGNVGPGQWINGKWQPTGGIGAPFNEPEPKDRTAWIAWDRRRQAAARQRYSVVS